jgi:hypothetical protein
MIAWSKGLGKQRLPLELSVATLKVYPGHLAMEGIIESVCWNYSIRLSPNDLRDFLKLLAESKTAQMLAERPGVLGPFLLGLIAIVPRLIVKLLTRMMVAAVR